MAAPLGRRRYAEADVGVRDGAIVEIGRPQFVAPAGPPPAAAGRSSTRRPGKAGATTPHHSSLPHVGLALIERCLPTPAMIRVRYRPHPLTGRRDPALRARASSGSSALVGRGAGSRSSRSPRRSRRASAMIGDVSSVINDTCRMTGRTPSSTPEDSAAARIRAVPVHGGRLPARAGSRSGLDAFVAAALGGRDCNRPRAP